MDNFVRINSSDELATIVKNTGNNLLVIYYYTKKNADCRKTVGFYEKLISAHPLSYFGIADLDKMDTDTTVNHMPRLDLYYMGNIVGSCPISSEKEIDQAVRTGEQYVITQNNLKNNMKGTPINQQFQHPVIQQPPYCMQQPMMQPMQQMIQQPMYQTPMNSVPQSTDFNISVPTMQQMQQMFQIFQMMHQMGVLNLNATPMEKNSDNEEILLPNGDKLVPLSNGKYGLIKKN
jgi:hypothetical protein